jgi:outer membrane immunogenic protein
MTRTLRIASAVLGLGALAVSPALSADLSLAPVYKAPASIVAPSWSGFYAGVHAGYGWGEAKVSPQVGPAFTPDQAQWFVDNGSPTLNTSGALGGFQAGYNFQNGPVVWGLEADFSFSGVKGSRSTPLLVPPAPLGLLDRSFAEHDSLKWMATFRGRIGWATPNVLLYATGGLAVGEREFSQFVLTDPTVNVNNLRNSVTATKVGWTVGGGVEYALTRNWSVKGEYLYTDLGTISATTDSDTAPGFGVTLTSASQFRMHSARGGVNYKFDWVPLK